MRRDPSKFGAPLEPTTTMSDEDEAYMSEESYEFEFEEEEDDAPDEEPEQYGVVRAP